METSNPALVALSEARQRTIDTLCRHFANDALELAEFERRLDRAHRAVSLVELRALVADLPGAGKPAEVPDASAAPRSVAAPEHDVILAIMGGINRKGSWTPPRELVVCTFMGGAELDFREARLGPGVTEVKIYTLMGGVKIIVPPELQVETTGFAFMGGFDRGGPRTREPAPALDAPILRVRAHVVMGGVEIECREPRKGDRSSAPAVRHAGRR